MSRPASIAGQGGIETRPWVRFGLVMLAFLLALKVFRVSSGFYGLLEPLETLTARVTYVLIELTGMEALRNGNVLVHPAGFGYEIYHMCTGVPVAAFLVTGLLALPNRGGNRLVGSLVGAAVVFCINFVRLVSLFHIGVRKPEVFDLAHSVLWEAGMIVLVLTFWFWWVGCLPLRRRS